MKNPRFLYKNFTYLPHSFCAF